ncbi:MAG: asparagine synthase (glutamine-hydrolyzing) [Bacteroidota bacterium]|nr:asparagine synthase (glutamine-hydrolyzing) [Bacteroidota bacterium]
MCGITGYISFVENETPSLEVLRAMTDTIAYRGPDDHGYWQERNIGLGHRRLSILDLSPLGHQPMSVASLHSKIIFNGEIYNFQEIRAELESRGRKFISTGDTEVILHAYDEWGTQCVERFNGMFAFAIFDEKKRILFIARDRLGVKPLHYYFDKRHFVFASEIKAILKYPYVRKEMDMSAVEQYFAFKYIAAPRTIFKNMFKLLPGNTLTITLDGVLQMHQYWDPLLIYSQRNGHERSEQDYENELEQLIDSSVRYRMISDVPVGAFLSGGIDSSVVVSSMVKQSSHVKTFSIGFTDHRYNEAPFAKAVASALGTDHEELIVCPEEIFDSIELLADHFDEPFADPSSIPTYLVSKLARSKVTVALSGDAGDELFWGYSRYKKYAAARTFNVIPAAVRKAIFHAFEKIPVDIIQKGAQGLQYSSLEDCYDYLSGMFKRNDLQKLMNHHIVHQPSLFTKDFRNFVTDELMYPNMVDFKTYLPDDILTKVDRTSMAVSLEARAPFLDYRLVEFGLGLPLQYKVRNGEQKYLLKKILYKNLPKTLFDRPKQGFDLPLNEWFRKELKPMLQQHLSKERLSRYGFINVDYVHSIMDAHFSGRYNYYYMLWTLLSFDLWYERYFE